MIITRQKKREDILQKVGARSRVFLLGCGECATACRTGGERELAEMSAFLEEHGREVTGCFRADVGCILPAVRRDLRGHRAALDRADAVLVLSCGLGCQVATEATGKPVLPACDTIFAGSQWKTELAESGAVNTFEEKCVMCGNCILDLTGGLCPYTLCAKGMINGPCGGTRPDGTCEAGNDQPCGWLLIYERLKKIGRLDLMKPLLPPRDWSLQKVPRRARVRL